MLVLSIDAVLSFDVCAGIGAFVDVTSFDKVKLLRISLSLSLAICDNNGDDVGSGGGEVDGIELD